MRTLLSLKKWLLPVASATAVAILIAVMVPTTAGAAGISTTTPLLASMVCVGSLSNSPDTKDLPDGDVAVIGAFEQRVSTDVAPFSESASGTVYFTMGLLVDAPCTSLDSNGQAATAGSIPCGQTSDWVGTYKVSSKGTFPVTAQPAVISATATNVGQVAPLAEPAPLNSDPFEGCTATFEVYPYAKSTSSNMTFTGLTGTCKMAGSAITLECENH